MAQSKTRSKAKVKRVSRASIVRGGEHSGLSAAQLMAVEALARGRRADAAARRAGVELATLREWRGANKAFQRALAVAQEEVLAEAMAVAAHSPAVLQRKVTEALEERLMVEGEQALSDQALLTLQKQTLEQICRLIDQRIARAEAARTTPSSAGMQVVIHAPGPARCRELEAELLSGALDSPADSEESTD